MRASKLFSIEKRRGEPVRAAGWTIAPVTRVVRLSIPGIKGGLIWNRPIAVEVETGGAPVRSLLVPDVTRQIQWTILGGVFIGLILVRLLVNQRRSSNE